MCYPDVGESYRDDSVAAPDHGVAVVVVAAPVGAAAHADHPPRLGHLVVNLPEGGRHLVGQRARHDDHVGLARGGAEHDAVPGHGDMGALSTAGHFITSHLSMSYLGAAICIISTAQHASPNVRGHREPWSHEKSLTLK